MRYLILLPCFIFASLTLFNSVSYGFSYYVDNFTQVGGVSGASTFSDDFDDGAEPPDGFSGASSYHMENGATFSSNRESGGLLELNSNDFVVDPDDFWINAELDDSTYYFSSGAGGSISGMFEANNGFTADTHFGIGLQNYDPSFTRFLSPELSSGEAWVEIALDSLGNKYAVWGNDIEENIMDITADLGTNTAITMALIINNSNQLTATWDYGSDGIIDLRMDKFFTASFLSNLTYSGSFESGAGGISNQPVPEPTTILLLGIGIAGLAGAEVRRRRRKNAVDKS